MLELDAPQQRRIQGNLNDVPQRRKRVREIVPNMKKRKRIQITRHGPRKTETESEPCSILRKARVDGRTGQLDSSDEETEEDCMEAEDLPSSFISFSGVDLVEGKSVKKKKRMKQELVTHHALPTCADHVGRCALHCMH